MGLVGGCSVPPRDLYCALSAPTGMRERNALCVIDVRARLVSVHDDLSDPRQCEQRVKSRRKVSSFLALPTHQLLVFRSSTAVGSWERARFRQHTRAGPTNGGESGEGSREKRERTMMMGLEGGVVEVDDGNDGGFWRC